MAWKYISYLCIALTTASAYRQIRYSGLVYQEDEPRPEPMIHRRVDTGDVTFADRPDRVQNERSIPFRSNSQALQGQSWDRSVAPSIHPEPRNGNMSVRVENPLTKANPLKKDLPVNLDSVVFPGPTSRSSLFVPEIPTECDNHLGFCEQIPNYPQQFVDDLLSKMADVKYRFNLDVDTPEIAQRRGSDPYSQELCPSRKTIIYPKAAKTIQGKWVLVINRDGKPVQGFKAEVCVGIDETCNPIVFVNNGYNATCHQKKLDRTMWSLDQNGEMVMETIAMPTCCSCYLKSVVRE